MRRRFGAWMHRSRRVLAVITVVAGLLLLLIALTDVVQGIGITYWQHRAQSCGTIYDGGDWSVGPGDTQAAATCFLRAYRQCHAATLVEPVGEIPPRWEYIYLIEPALLAVGGHACSIQLNSTVEVAPASTPGWVACAEVAQRWYGLHFFGCGTYGDRFVGMAPLSQSPPGVACGDIQVPFGLRHPRVVDASARTVVTCFMRARQTCQPAWAQVTVRTSVDNEDRQLLLVEPSHQTCVVLELEWSGSWHGSQFLPLRHGSYAPPTICTKLVLTEYGLYVESCARAGEPIVLPICEGQLPIPSDTLCAPIPPAKN